MPPQPLHGHPATHCGTDGHAAMHACFAARSGSSAHWAVQVAYAVVHVATHWMHCAQSGGRGGGGVGVGAGAGGGAGAGACAGTASAAAVATGGETIATQQTAVVKRTATR